MIRTAIYTIGFLVAVFGGVPFVQNILKRFESGKEENGGRAGRAIGILERAIIVPLVFVEAYGAIGLVLAAKSIARFEQLKNRKFAEYYLIGTLASLSFGIIVGLLTHMIAQAI
jgi:hypothetical protein